MSNWDDPSRPEHIPLEIWTQLTKDSNLWTGPIGDSEFIPFPDQPDLKVPYRNGHPDFSGHIVDVDLPNGVDGRPRRIKGAITITLPTDFSKSDARIREIHNQLADAEFKRLYGVDIEALREAKSLTWHHGAVLDSKGNCQMILVDRDLHLKCKHFGGYAMWKRICTSSPDIKASWLARIGDMPIVGFLKKATGVVTFIFTMNNGVQGAVADGVQGFGGAVARDLVMADLVESGAVWMLDNVYERYIDRPIQEWQLGVLDHGIYRGMTDVVPEQRIYRGIMANWRQRLESLDERTPSIYPFFQPYNPFRIRNE